MSIVTTLPLIGSLIDSITKGLDELFTSDEEQGEIDLEKKRLELQRLAVQLKAQHAQLEINMVQAKHPSLFVAGARPAIIWIGALGLAYEAILRPLLNGLVLALSDERAAQLAALQDKAAALTPQTIEALTNATSLFPSINTDLFMPIVLGVLGIGGMRSWEKIQGKARDNLQPPDMVEAGEYLAAQALKAKKAEQALAEDAVRTQGRPRTGNPSVDAYNAASAKPDYRPHIPHPADVLDVEGL